MLLWTCASGKLCSVELSKRELAAEVAAILAFSAVNNSDKVGLLLFSDDVELFIPSEEGTPAYTALNPRDALFRAQRRRTNLDLPPWIILTKSSLVAPSYSSFPIFWLRTIASRCQSLAGATIL